MELRLFTTEQANAMMPYLEAKTRRIRSLKEELDVTMNRLSVLSVIADSGASPKNPDHLAHECAETEAKRLDREIQNEVENIQSRGCIMKDLGQGLVDFYSLRGDRLVFLCWRAGEADVSFWHSLDGGFASRRPIEAHEA